MFNVKDFRESGDDGDSSSIQRAIDACSALGYLSDREDSWYNTTFRYNRLA
jgi:hypothetical protein